MPGRLATIIALGRRHHRRGRPGCKPVLDLRKPVEVITSKGEIVLAQELPRRVDFGLVDRGSNVNPRFQALDEALGESSMVFSRHDLPAPYAVPAP